MQRKMQLDKRTNENGAAEVAFWKQQSSKNSTFKEQILQLNNDNKWMNEEKVIECDTRACDDRM